MAGDASSGTLTAALAIPGPRSEVAHVRPASPMDTDALDRLYAMSHRMDPQTARARRPHIHGRADCLLVAVAPDGTVTGSGWSVRPPIYPRHVRQVFVNVFPQWRGRGHGSALMGQIKDSWAPEVSLVTSVSWEWDDPAGSRFATKHGFSCRMVGHEMYLDARAIQAPSPLPAGLTVEVFDPRQTLDDAEINRLYIESETSPETQVLGAGAGWREMLPQMNAYGRDGALVLLRVHGVPAAMTVALVTPEGVWRIGITLVHPDFRGRGLSRILKEHLHAHGEAHGAVGFHTANSSENVPMLRTNTRLGYRMVQSQLRWLMERRAA